MPNVIVESKNLGHVTAYAYAKSKGYTGTEEEFAELMASYATVAETAGAAAQAAESSAEDSEAYAVGKRNGIDVDSDDPAYHNNSKWYSEQLSEWEDEFLKADIITKLPAGYQQVEYLESDGTQILITTPGTHKLNQDSRVWLRFAKTGSLTSGPQLFGSRKTTSSNAFYGQISAAGNIYVGYAGDSMGTGVKAELNRIYDLDVNKNTVSLDGVLKNTVTAETFETPSNGRLFGIRGNTSSSVFYGSLRVYRYKEWANGTLIADLYPARRLSDNVLGMYDLVNNRFATNQGTGTFISGKDINIQSQEDDITALAGRTEAVMSSIAPIEDGATASQAYAQGEYFYRGGFFCKATAAIPSGGTFTKNTNYVETTVAADVSDIMQTITPYISNDMTAPAALSVGDYVLAAGTLYRVTASIASGGTITPNTNAVATTEAAELQALDSAKVNKTDWIVNDPGTFLLSKILCQDYAVTTSGRTMSKKFNRLSNVFNSSSSVTKAFTFTGESVNGQTSTIGNLTSIPVANCIPLSVLATVRGDLYFECYSVSSYTGSTSAFITIFFWTVNGDTVTKAGATALVSPANQRYTITKIPAAPEGATHFSLCQYTGGAGPTYDCVINIKIVPTTA